jgi:energy-coupling factor transport system substrate-specific component
MTWQLASFAVLAFALATGFWWYERSRPPAKVLAIVATLAALAAIGRIAFAPLPNIKPTTDIVLIAGYVLGGAPGFVVGALTALVSNLFFGQGPYTPWQMVSWGLVGVFGAVVARLVGRDLGRVPLAAACGAAGLGYGLIMDGHMWVMYSGHTLAELWVVLGRGLPFNLAHAIGNVLFCLAFGPLLVRTLRRFRSRLEVRWIPVAPRPAAPVAAALAALAVIAGGLAAPPPAEAAGEAQVRYLRGVQNADGGFGASPGQSSSPMYTGWAVLGLAAADVSPSGVRRNGRSPVDYLVATIGRVRETADLQRTILALVAAGRSPRDVRGRNLVAELVRKRRRDGSFSGLVNQTAFAILALRASGRATTDPTVRSAARWLTRQQNDDGGFNFATRGGQSGVDDTAGAIQALVAAGRGGPRSAVAKGAVFLARAQNADGGFPLNPGMASNAQSAAWAVQALVAAGRDPDRQRRGGARAPRAYLRSLAAGSGAVRYSRTSAQTPIWVTAQALTGLAARPLPIRPRAAARSAAAVPTPTPAAAPRPATSAAETATSRPRPAAARPRATRDRAVPNRGAAVAPGLAPVARAAGVLVAVLVPTSDRPA